MSKDWRQFQVGDLVTRDGTDVHRIVQVTAAGDGIEVECVRPPASNWTSIGEREFNCAWRYDFAGATIDTKEPQP